MAVPSKYWQIPVRERCDLETNISPNSTDCEEEMSDYRRRVLEIRHSRPHYVDRWDIFNLTKMNSSWVWTASRIWTAEDPLSEPPTFDALSDMLRISARLGRPCRMVRRNQRVSRGRDGMGFEIMSNSVVVVFNVSLIDYKELHVNKELSGDLVWLKTLDTVEYTSSELLTEFMKHFNLKDGTFCDDTGGLARFRVVCPRAHKLCNVDCPPCFVSLAGSDEVSHDEAEAGGGRPQLKPALLT